MNNKKIIMSFLLVLLIAISVSAVSAADIIADNQDSISSNDNSINEIATEDISKDINDKSLSDGVSTGGNNWIVKPSTDGKSDANSIQKAINLDNTKPGDSLLLTDKNFTLEKSVSLNKDLTINGGNIYNQNNLTDLFIIDPKSEGGPKNITITNVTFYVNGNENIVLANGENYGTTYIDLANIKISNCTILPINPDSNINDTVLLNIKSDRTVGQTGQSTGFVLVSGNKLNGINTLKNNDYVLKDDFVIQKADPILNTALICPNMTITTYDKNTNDTPSYYEVKLIDQNVNPVINRTIQIGFNGKIYDRTSDENGIAKVKLTLAYTSVYTFAVYFLGDESYASAFDVSTVTIIKKNATITPKTVSYNVNAKTKTLTATLKDKNNKALANKKVTFTVNGKTYTATTNSKGVASAKISLSKKGTYTFTAQVLQGTISIIQFPKKGKLTLNPLSTNLTVKKYTFKKAATKKIQVTLKSGKTVLKSKKLTIKVNGKTYSGKTNTKGIATITIKLTKKGTYTYTANFAGDNTYKAISKSQKVVIK
ncbi:adhesin-like protein [Methanobrevibacter ruminantium M1]|uniref:Adhesin-like protein n=1 Tax=Methanobrevibacter ruminantium (strain ATCC 35063 / DSM 1093 / JCM 13430 / OCM 146 / M1) TaxID=634498 RepID=D3E007_METRM|nr:Ig-like domain repeat protein [Methanobrevibacter ruminantium]ADC46183.1 adhesin-like protein [Methanobrevibacter ruminantium M1]